MTHKLFSTTSARQKVGLANIWFTDLNKLYESLFTFIKKYKLINSRILMRMFEMCSTLDSEI